MNAKELEEGKVYAISLDDIGTYSLNETNSFPEFIVRYNRYESLDDYTLVKYIGENQLVEYFTDEPIEVIESEKKTVDNKKDFFKNFIYYSTSPLCCSNVKKIEDIPEYEREVLINSEKQISSKIQKIKKKASTNLMNQLSMLYPNGYKEAMFEHIVQDFEQKTYKKVTKK